MNIGKLIEDILTEIGFATDGGSISDAEGRRCLTFINETIQDLNTQDFLHFTKDIVSLPLNRETEFILPDAPVKVDKLSFRMGNYVYRVKPKMIDAFVNYLDGSFGAYPRVFVYDRIFKDGAMVGRIRIDRPSSYQLTAVVTNNIDSYTANNQQIALPPEYISVLKAGAQYRFLSNSGSDESLKRSKAYEYTSKIQSIKESMFVGIDDSRDVGDLDPIHTGAGRL